MKSFVFIFYVNKTRWFSVKSTEKRGKVTVQDNCESFYPVFFFHDHSFAMLIFYYEGKTNTYMRECVCV